MAGLETIHDLPLLAKETGFFFRFRNRRIEWRDIAELDIEEIVNKRNFEHLEEKMELVLNYDLNDDAVKVLDRDLVKLLRLSQLSVSYLAHCCLYLDKCLLVLGKQLADSLQECEGLRKLNSDKADFPCNECKKSFITESLLVSHETRRHSSKPSYLDAASQTDQTTQLLNKGQQTDDVRQVSTPAQTEWVHCNSVSVMTDFEDSSNHDYERKLKDVTERMEEMEATMARIRYRPSMPETVDSKADKCDTSKNEFHESDVQEVHLHGNQGVKNADVVDLVKIMQQLVQTVQNKAQDSLAVTTNVIKKDWSEMNETQMLPEIKHPHEFLKDLEIKESEEKSAPERSQVNETTKISKNDSVKQAVQHTRKRKKVFMLQEQTALEIPQPKPRTKFPAVKRNDSMSSDRISFLEEENDKTSKGVANIAEQISEEAVEKSKEKGNIQVAHERMEDSESDQMKYVPSVSEEEGKSPVDEYITIKQKNIGQHTVRDRMPVDQKISKENKNEYSHIKKASIFQSFAKNKSQKLKSLKSFMKKSLSNLYEESRRKHEEVREKMTRSQSEVELDGGGYNRDEVNKKMNMKLQALGVDPEWPGLPDMTRERAMAALSQRQQYKEKTIPGYSIIYDAVEQRVQKEMELRKKSVKNSTPSHINAPQMYNVDIDSDSDYSAHISYSPEKLTKKLPQGTKVESLLEPSTLKITKDSEPTQSSTSSDSPVKITRSQNNVGGKTSYQEIGAFSNLILSPLKDNRDETRLTAHMSGEILNSSTTPFKTNIQSIDKKPTEYEIDSFLESTEELIAAKEIHPSQVVPRKPSSNPDDVSVLTKVVKNSSRMYTAEDSSSIESIEDIPPKRSAEQTKNIGVLQSVAVTNNFEKKDTDFSIFQVGKNKLSSSDSEEERKIIPLKSSLLNKGKDEARKRVVFADNFPLDINADNNALFALHETDLVDSGSDWDIAPN